MVNKCSAINCKSGCAEESKNAYVSFHKFPLKDEELLKVSVIRVARKDFKPNQYSRLCSLHFKPENFIEDFIDQDLKCKRRRQQSKLERRRLKHDAISSIFKNLSAYNCRKDAPSRSTLSLTSSRGENERAILEVRGEKFFQDDKLTSFDELIAKRQ